MESAKAILDEDEVHDVVDAVKVDFREDHIDSISGDKPGWDNNGKPGNQVATKSLPLSEIFSKIPL